MEDRSLVILINRPDGSICTVQTPCICPWIQGFLKSEEVTVRLTDIMVAKACEKIQNRRQNLQVYLDVVNNFLWAKSANEVDEYTVGKLAEQHIMRYVLGIDELRFFDKFPSKGKHQQFRKEIAPLTS